jgi:actin related protein 2/3 complex subunit 1A/1B
MQGFIETTSAIAAHAWNADMTQLAIAPNNNELHILEVQGGSLVEKDIYDDSTGEQVLLPRMKEHMQAISGIDWCAANDKIVTCSHDRTASVWARNSSGDWDPEGVELPDFNMSATCVAWAPNGLKFAVGSSGKLIQVCFYYEEHNMWIGQKITAGLDSSILTTAFHPSGLLLAAGGIDKTINVYTTWKKDYDTKADGVAYFGGMFDKPPKLGTSLFVLPVQGWVNCVAFSPSGNTLAVATHDSRLHLISVTVADKAVTCEAKEALRLPGLPLSQVGFLGDNKIVAAGYDMIPIAFTASGDSWAMTGSLESGKKKKKKKTGAAQMWQDKDNRGGQEEHTHHTTHEGNITSLRVRADSEMFTTAGLDGRVVFWDASLANGFAGLTLRT